MTLRLNLGRYLKDHDITAYRLVQEVQGKVAPNTVYSLARKPAQRIDLDTVAKILQALGRVKGQKVEITEMLEDVQETAPASPTLENLLTRIPAVDPATLPVFKHDPKRRPIPLGSGPSITELISEGRDQV